MAVDAGSIFSDVRIRLDKLNADVKAVDAKFDQLGKDIRSSNQKTEDQVTTNFNNISLSGIAAFAGISLAAKEAIKTFALTEQSLANVEAVTNATASEFNDLEKAAEAAGRTTRFTASQAADALFFLSSAGFDAAQSIDALDGVLQLAGATQSDLAFTAETVASVISQFGLAAEEATRISNVFAAANSNSQATLEKLASAFRQAGPIAGQFGISVEETTASLQALFNAGLRGEQAGTSIRNILLELGNESSTTSEKLIELGLTFDEFNPKAVGLTGSLEVLGESGIDLGNFFTSKKSQGQL